MEIGIFLIFVGVCAFVLLWTTRNSNGRVGLAHRNREQKRVDQADKLATPTDNLLAHKRALWQQRRTNSNSGVVKTNSFTPRFESSGVPEYDGYSRRDRHHVRERTAEIKGEAHSDDEFAIGSAGKLKTDKHAAQT